ncbi:targeting protein for Xklp2 homolog [Elysia marginata]|uniref:Targeting protein for Xklp2 homolog n=1 Tax=Elysia marginata TaxID=1093978 RepID=A0AAV4EG06_9GAST|nr:targeting protein for Xklp2 homolog [Elysia marginata]
MKTTKDANGLGGRVGMSFFQGWYRGEECTELKIYQEIDDFQLNTDIRAASREQYDQHLKQREATLEAIKRQRLERQEEEEKAAIMKMRKEAIHIATGIKKYKPQVIKPSDMPLTQAQTPKFSDRFRARLHSQ